MKKYFSFAFFSTLLVGMFAIAGVSTTSAYSTYQGASCPSYYHPVCGEKSGQQTVYQNICTMNSAGATFVKWKSCGYFSNTSYYNQYSNSYNYGNTWDYTNNYYTRPVYTTPADVCSQDHNPVCAVKNGYKKSYSNKCFARENGADFLKYGDCEEKIKQKITCVFHDSNSTQSCSVRNGTSGESCSGKTSCSFWTSARPEGTLLSIKNSCGADNSLPLGIGSGNNSTVNTNFSCTPLYMHQCVTRSTPYCTSSQKKVFQGYDSQGCSKGYKCVQEYVNTYNYRNTNSGYYNNSQNNYSQNYYGNNYNYSTYNPTFALSRLKNNLLGTVALNTVFTVKIYSGQSGSTITHFIPEGIEFLETTKGSCQKRNVYGGTQLKCHNVDSITYKAKSSYSTCKKKFTTSFSNYNYNNQYRTFTLSVR